MNKLFVNTVSVLIIFMLSQITVDVKVVHSAVSDLKLKYKTQAITPNERGTITAMSLLVSDINKDNKNEIAITGNGYAQILEWNGTTFESKWKSQQFSHQWGPIKNYYEISRLVPATYYSDKHLQSDYLFFAYTTPKSSYIYRIMSNNNRYELQKLSVSPFNWFGSYGMCEDGTSFIAGKKAYDKGNYVVAFKWNSAELIEKWRGVSGTKIVASGDLLNKAGRFCTFFLVKDNKNTGFLSCKDGSIDWTAVDIDEQTKEMMRTNRIDMGNGRMGSTKKNSPGELWTVQYSEIDNDYTTKLYVSQYDGKKLSPLTRVSFKGINPDMIYQINITDVDNDGVGEILGIEEEVRKIIPRESPDYEADTRLITSNMFVVKWNGKEYEVKWHAKAIDEKITNFALADVVGDKKQEIIVTDEKGYLYVFEMPNIH